MAKGLAVRAALKSAKRNTLVSSTGRKYLANLFELQRAQKSKGRQDSSSAGYYTESGIERAWMEVPTFVSSFLALLTLMTMLLSSGSAFCWMSANTFFSDGYLVPFQLAAFRLGQDFVQVTYQRQAKKKQVPMRMTKAMKIFAPSTLLLLAYLVKALKEAKMSSQKKKVWKVSSRYLVILRAFTSISALFLRVNRKMVRQTSQITSRMTMMAPALLTTSLVVPRIESLEQQGPKEKPKQRAMYFRLEDMGDNQSVLQPVEQKTVKQRQGTSQATETECSAYFLGAITRLRNSSTRERTKMAAEVMSQKPQLSEAIQLAGGKAVTSRLVEKDTLGSNLGALYEDTSCSLLDWEQLSVSLWFCRLALYSISKLMKSSSAWLCGRITVLQALAGREVKETAKLLLLRRIGSESCRVILILFLRGNLTIFSNDSSTAAVSVHEERLLTTSHLQPLQILQLSEQPSPFKLLPSSH